MAQADIPAGESVRETMAFSRSLRLPVRAFESLPLPSIQHNRDLDATVLDARESDRAPWPAKVAAWCAEEEAHGRAFLFLPVFLGLGAILWLTSPTTPSTVPAFCALPLILAAVLLARAGRRVMSCCLLVPGLICAGAALAEIESLRNSTILLDAPVTTQIEGIVEKREAAASGRWRYTVRLISTAAPVIARPPERAVILSRAAHRPFETGDRIAGKVRLSPPSGPALPGLADFAFSAYFQGTGAVGYFYGPPQRLGTGITQSWTTTVIGKLFELRSDIGTRIRTLVPGDAGAFAAAIVTDERRAISDKTVEALRVAGLAHIIAISGLNMALAAGIFFVGARLLLSAFSGLAQEVAIKKIAALGAIAMVTAYYLISGFGVSAERAYVMMVIMLASVLFDRPSISLHNVALSAVVILVLTPSAVLGPSFQMSFSATVALVAGYAAWSRFRGDQHNPLSARQPPVLAVTAAVSGMVAGVVMTSLIGSLSTSIYSISHFHRIATYGLAGNLAAMPVISLIVMPAGMLGMLMMPFGLEAPFIKIMGYGVQLVIAIAETVAGWGGDAAVGRQSVWLLPLASIGFLLLVLLRTRLKLVGAAIMAVALTVSFWPRGAARPDLLVSDDATLVALVEENEAAVSRRTPPEFTYRQWQNALMIDKTLHPIMAKSSAGPLPASSDLSSKPAMRPLAGAKNNPSKASAEDRADRTPAAGAIDLLAEDIPPPEPPARDGRAPENIDNPDNQARALSTQERREAAVAMADAFRTAPAGRFACLARIGCFARSADKIRIAVIEDARYAGTACDTSDIVIAARARFETCRSGALMLTEKTLRKTGALEIRFAQSATRANWTATAANVGHSRPWSLHRSYDWKTRRFDDTLPQPVSALLNGSDG
ncbi:ComEC/Rec2-related protein [Neorhizobium galegae]|uniref:ComEC/Rec2 family competence protein n=1 Tax=Neorhizobium galegae TaxID=399 RepID=UPI001AE69573|nr:ComEC/Rec2-related protein [Neorhizobium galegae]